MADNKTAGAAVGVGPTFVTMSGSWSGDTADLAGCTQLFLNAGGAEGSWTFTQASVNSGAKDAGTQRVILASDDAAVTALQLIDNAISGAGFNITQFGGASVPIGAGVEATAVRVTLATDSTGVVSVDDNGGSFTVDAPVGTPAFVRLSDGAAAITTLAVSLASVPSHAVTNAGTFLVQENGSWIQVDDAAFTPATSKIAMIGAEFDDTTPDSVDEGDGGAMRMSSRRELYVQLRDAAGNERGMVVDASGFPTVNVNGTVTVGSHAVTNAGTFAVQAAQSGTWNIGTVTTVTTCSTVTTVSNVTGGTTAHDGAGGSINPLAVGGYASAAAPSDVSADADIVRAWHLRNGAAATVLTATGALIGGDAANGLDVDVTRMSALVASTATIGDVGLIPRTSGGVTPYFLISAATTNGTNVKASAGQLFGMYVTNINAAVRYFKLYDKATAPTVGTDTPVQTYAVPGNATGAGFTRFIPLGIAFASGIGFGLTTGVASADTGAVAANELVVNLEYK